MSPSEREAAASGNAELPVEGRFAYDRLERTIHEKARLGILTSLAMHAEGLLFKDLKSLCNLTDGNLNRHLAVLEENRLVQVWKGRAAHGRGGRQTMYRLTADGRRRLVEYVSELEQVVRDVEAATRDGGAGIIPQG